MGAQGPGTDQASSDRSPFLIGRDRELEWLLGLVSGIREHGGGLVVRGEAGIGKSALVASAAASASEGISVFRTSAVQSEMRLPFSELHQFLLPFLDRLDGLPEVQRHALEMALGLAPREAAPDVFGPTPFVESVIEMLINAGHDPSRVRAERFGATGG